MSANEKQQIIFDIEATNDGMLNIKFNFEPALAGPSSKEIEQMSETQKTLQNYAAHIAEKIMQVMK